jgi:hypothetical protein
VTALEKQILSLTGWLVLAYQGVPRVDQLPKQRFSRLAS